MIALHHPLMRSAVRLTSRAASVGVAVALAACAHLAPTALTSTASSGEVAIAPAPPASAVRVDALRPIALDELLGVRTTTVSTDRRVETWYGDYEGRTYGQRGALALVVQPGGLAHGARGYVAWRVTPRQGLAAAADAPAVAPAVLVRSRIASATQQRAAGDSTPFVLELTDYFDPACNCTARATFRGVQRGDTLVGRFTIAGAATVVGEGRGKWRAVRGRE